MPIKRITKGNYNEFFQARIYGFLFFFQYFTENHYSSLRVSEKESSAYFGSPVPVLEDLTSV